MPKSQSQAPKPARKSPARSKRTLSTAARRVVSADSPLVPQQRRFVDEFAAGADHAEEQAAQATATAAAIEAVRNEERRRMAAAVEIARDDAQKQAAAAAADAVGARDERDRLRARVNSLARAAVTRDLALADGSPSGAAAVDLLAYMFGRAVDRAEALASIADRARIAGLTCERAYTAVRGARGN